MTNRILRLPEVVGRTGIGRSTIYAKIADNDFPKPIKLGLRSVGWLESDLEQWIINRIEISQT